MPMLTRWLGVTETAAERNLAVEQAYSDAILEKVLLMQASAAAKQHRPLCRGTHAKGIIVRARFEILDIATNHDPQLAARLAQGIFARPDVYAATVRFANSDSCVNSDFKGDIRALSFSVDLTSAASGIPVAGVERQDFTLQSAATLPLNDAPAFLATMQVITASKPARALWSLAFRDKLRVIRALTLAELQARQPIQPYQNLRYWSTVPFRHGPADVAKHSLTPAADNPARPLAKNHPDAMQDELARHINDDPAMSNFDFGIQLLDADKMTYWGKRSMEGNRIALSHSRQIDAPAPVTPLGRCQRRNVFRRHRSLDSGEPSARKHQSRSVPLGGCKPAGADQRRPIGEMRYVRARFLLAVFVWLSVLYQSALSLTHAWSREAVLF